MNISIVPVLEGGQSYGDQVSYGWEAVVRKHLGTYPIHLSGFGASDPVTVPQALVAAGYYLTVTLEEWRGLWPNPEKVCTLIEHKKIELDFKRTVGGHHVDWWDEARATVVEPFQKTLSSAPEITYKLMVQLYSEKEGPVELDWTEEAEGFFYIQSGSEKGGPIESNQVVFPFVNRPVYLIWDVELARSGGVEEVREIDGAYRRVIQGARSCCWVGDLDGDNRCDFVHGVSAQHIAAYRYDGMLLWRWDDPEGVAIYNSASTRVFDVNGDGKAEVICRQGDEICILEGATGKRLTSMPCPPTRLPGGLGEHGPRFYFANFRGLSSPRDILMELGEVNQSTLVALQGEDLKELWRFDVTAQMKKDGGAGGHCPVVEDMDGDGKDEVAFGTYLLDHNGKIRWSKAFASIGMGDEEDHVDCIEVGDLFGNGEKVVIYSTNGVVLRAMDGKEIWRHNTHHGQWVRILRVLPNTDESQILLADKYEPPILLDSSGKRLDWSFPVATFCLPDWDGDGKREAVSRGVVWDLKGRAIGIAPGCEEFADLLGVGADAVFSWGLCYGGKRMCAFSGKPVSTKPENGPHIPKRIYNHID